MARREIHSSEMPIEQKKDITDDPSKREPEIVVCQQMPNEDYSEALAFNEEPVTIQLDHSAVPNAPSAYPVWVNGKGCEIWLNGRWVEQAYLPVGRPLTIKRKYFEVIVRAKSDTVHTEVREKEGENPNNIVNRFTSPVHNFTLIEDKNPRGIAWLQELRRRNF